MTFFSPQVNIIIPFYKDDENKIKKKSLSFHIPIFVINGYTNGYPVKYCRAQQNCKKGGDWFGKQKSGILINFNIISTQFYFHFFFFPSKVTK